MRDPNQHPDLDHCPCGGALSVIVTVETKMMGGMVVDSDSDRRVWCSDCDDWSDGGAPDGITDADYLARLAHHDG